MIPSMLRVTAEAALRETTQSAQSGRVVGAESHVAMHLEPRYCVCDVIDSKRDGSLI